MSVKFLVNYQTLINMKHSPYADTEPLHYSDSTNFQPT